MCFLCNKSVPRKYLNQLIVWWIIFEQTLNPHTQVCQTGVWFVWKWKPFLSENSELLHPTWMTTLLIHLLSDGNGGKLSDVILIMWKYFPRLIMDMIILCRLKQQNVIQCLPNPWYWFQNVNHRLTNLEIITILEDGHQLFTSIASV